MSRAESLELIGSGVLDGWQVNVLQRIAEVDPGNDTSTAPRAVTEYHGTNEGTARQDLHRRPARPAIHRDHR